MGTTLQSSTPCSRWSSPPSTILFMEIPLFPVLRNNIRGLPTLSVRGLTPQSVSHSPLNPSWIHLQSRNSSQINIDSGGHSWSLPPRSEPHWGQTRSSRPPSPPGLWYRRIAPGRRCLWSARWRHVPRWWRHGPTSRRSASHMPPPTSLLPGESPRRSNEVRLNYYYNYTTSE